MDLSSFDILFYIFSSVAVLAALLVVFVSNPIYSALFLVVVMSILGILFFALDAHFVAATQIIVYAGAVMVLFVMVMMLFDLKKDRDDVAKFSPNTILKILGCGIVCGVLVGAGMMVTSDGAGFIETATADKPTQPMVLKNEINAPTTETTNPEELKKEVVEITQNPQAGNEIFTNYTDTQKLSLRLFSKFIFVFELLSVLLLVAIVGAVALAKSKGGTHNASRRP